MPDLSPSPPPLFPRFLNQFPSTASFPPFPGSLTLSISPRTRFFRFMA
ncbi:hypothetical protein LINPERPRIM_LOCUS23360 [Linum perenne]